jgi:dihydroorotate dehydrogenase electron transfer subunit
MKQFSASIHSIKPLGKTYYKLSFAWPQDLRVPWPGQFVTIRAEERISPFLRRPFALSAFDLEKRLASIIFEVRGPATTILSQRHPGDVIDVLGPRGFPFQVDKDRQTPLLVAGGIGTGPMVFAANWLVGKGYEPTLVLGFRSQDWVPQVSLLPEVNLVITTDDGSEGIKGNPIEYLEKERLADKPSPFLWSCGPHGLLAAAHAYALAHNIPDHASVEQIMACGVGACAGCTIDVTDEREVVRVCTEGPVFRGEVIRWT